MDPYKKRKMNKQNQEIKKLKSTIITILKKRGIVKARIFGSYKGIGEVW